MEMSLQVYPPVSRRRLILSNILIIKELEQNTILERVWCVNLLITGSN